ncbi:MAG TPA: hypothetical protein VLH56_02435 [Dissulfurispiraceae bacterium]|nr:hypothetical protein [Dissulfurispiraceae bacterium]
MARNPVGTMYVELDLDATKYTKAQKEILAGAEKNSADINRVFKTVGTQSDEMYNAMRKNIQNSLDAIKKSHLSSADEIRRAQESAAAKIKSIDDQQFGAQTSMIDKLKAHWVAATIAITAAIALISKAWNLAEAAAAYNEQMVLLDALARKHGTTSTAIVDSVTKAGEGMIGMADAAQVAAGALAKGITPKQLTDLAGAAVVMSDVMGVKVETAFKQFTAALETGRTRSITAAVGINAVTDATDEMLTKMTPAQKAVMAYNAIMEVSGKVSKELAGEQQSLADKMETFQVTLKDLELTMGQGIIRAGAGAAAAFYGLTSAINSVLGAIAGLGAYIAGKLGMDRLKAELDGVRDVANEQAELFGVKAVNAFGLATASTEELTRATAKQGAITDQAKISEKERQTTLSATVKAMQELSKAVDKWGEDELKLAKSTFGEKLKAELVTVTQMAGAMGEYASVIAKVFEARVAGEKAIEQAMQKAGAKPEDVLKQQLEILKSEKEYFLTRAEGWKTYYDTLAGMHAKATDQMAQKTKELAALENTIAAQRQAHATQMQGLQEKLMLAQGVAATDESIRIMKLTQLEKERSDANKLSGEAQITALKEVKDKYAALTDAVTVQTEVYDQQQGKYVKANVEVQSSVESIKKAMENVESVQGDLNRAYGDAKSAKEAEAAAVASWKAEVEKAMAVAKAGMDEYTNKVIALSKLINEMDKKIAISVDDAQAMSSLYAIKALLDSIQSKTVTVTVGMVGGAGAGGGGGVTGTGGSGYTGGADFYTGGGAFVPGIDIGTGVPFGGSFGGAGFALGLDYVPFDNFPARLHEGEAVLTKAEAAQWRNGGQSINFSPSINIVGANKSPEQLAREIVKPLQNELRRLAVMN